MGLLQRTLLEADGQKGMQPGMDYHRARPIGKHDLCD